MAENEEKLEEKKEKKKKRLLILLLLLLLGVSGSAMGVTLWVLYLRPQPPGVLAPDYAPQEVEENAEKIEDDSTEKLEAPEGGGAVVLVYQDDVTIDLSEGTATLVYGNPGKSTQDIILQIIIRDRLIAQSGRIEPGNQVTKLKLAEGAAQLLEPGGYDGKYALSFYNPQTGEKSALSTDVPVSITVVE